jgi:hypothetical protein
MVRSVWLKTEGNEECQRVASKRIEEVNPGALRARDRRSQQRRRHVVARSTIMFSSHLEGRRRPGGVLAVESGLGDGASERANPPACQLENCRWRPRRPRCCCREARTRQRIARKRERQDSYAFKIQMPRSPHDATSASAIGRCAPGDLRPATHRAKRKTEGGGGPRNVPMNLPEAKAAIAHPISDPARLGDHPFHWPRHYLSPHRPDSQANQASERGSRQQTSYCNHRSINR